MNTDKALDYPSIEDLFVAARRYESALAIGLQVGDDITCMVASARLRQALDRGNGLLKTVTLEPAHRWALQSMFCESSQGMRELLKRVPARAHVDDAGRLERWLRAPGRSAATSNGPDLFELDTSGAPLIDARFFCLHVVRCRFFTAMPGAVFIDAHVEGADFAYSRLDNSLLQATQVRRSHLRDTSFVNASFNNVTFVGCDLRYANFSVTRASTISSVRFIHCDLRGVLWGDRNLSDVTMVECQLDKLRVLPTASYLDTRSRPEA